MVVRVAPPRVEVQRIGQHPADLPERAGRKQARDVPAGLARDRRVDALPGALRIGEQWDTRQAGLVCGTERGDIAGVGSQRRVGPDPVARRELHAWPADRAQQRPPRSQPCHLALRPSGQVQHPCDVGRRLATGAEVRHPEAGGEAHRGDHDIVCWLAGAQSRQHVQAEGGVTGAIAAQHRNLARAEVRGARPVRMGRLGARIGCRGGRMVIVAYAATRRMFIMAIGRRTGAPGSGRPAIDRVSPAIGSAPLSGQPSYPVSPAIGPAQLSGQHPPLPRTAGQADGQAEYADVAQREVGEPAGHGQGDDDLQQ